MKTNTRGTILLASLTTLTIVAALVAVAVHATSTTARISDRSQDMTVVQAGAEGALEYGYAVWKARLAQKYAAISTAEAVANLQQPAFPDLAYVDNLTISAADQYGAPTVNPVPMQVDVAGFPGWRGRGYNYVARAKLRNVNALGNPVEYGVRRHFTYTEVPLFQTMFFFEHDIELYRSNRMLVSGLTHSNRWAFISNDLRNNLPVTFAGNASHVLGFTNSTLPYRAETWSGYVADSNANAPVTFASGAQLNQVSRLEPFGQDPASLLDPTPTSPLSPSGQYIGPIVDTDGNPNNDSMHEMIEPPVTTGNPPPEDPPAIAKRRLYSKAGLIISVNGGTKTITSQNGTASLTSTQANTIRNAITTTSSMYDKREQTNVRLTNIDMSAIRTTLESLAGFNGVLYIVDSTPTTDTVPKNAIRLQKGGELPANGLTIASPNGVYVQGDYNTGTTYSGTIKSPQSNGGNANNDKPPTVTGYERKPAAIVADAVMILSNAWNDSNASKGIGSRIASNTTVNAAFLGGFMPSGYTPANGSQYGYSGGANNYPRFLEDWSNRYFTYFGSMVELFASKNFTGRWDTGDIYAPPIRCWNYDTNFDHTSPPGSIDAVATSRGTWARY